MHEPVRQALRDWVVRTGGVAGKLVADLGAFNINGSVKEVIPGAVGFDLVAGPGVDVVIQLGVIPGRHLNRYDIVTCISSFQFCPHPHDYRREIAGLLKQGGLLFLTMCGPGCRCRHTTVPPFEDSFRVGIEELAGLLRPEIGMLEACIRVTDQHPDMIFVGERL